MARKEVPPPKAKLSASRQVTLSLERDRSSDSYAFGGTLFYHQTATPNDVGDFLAAVRERGGDGRVTIRDGALTWTAQDDLSKGA